MRIAICDDEDKDLSKYRDVLDSILEKNQLIAKVDTFQNAEALMFALEDVDKQPDILFLDINMPEINGIQVAGWIRDKQLPCEIIFLTVSQNHMLQAFDVGAFNYIVKDYTPQEKIEEICLRVISKIDQEKKEVITVSCAGESRIIPIRDILYFEVKNYIIIVHYSKTSFEFYSTMGKIENSLLGQNFVRAHRSYLVSLLHIRSVTRQEIELSDGSQIPIGRKYLNDLRMRIQQRAEE